MDDAIESPRMRWPEVRRVLGGETPISRSYGRTLVRRGLLTPHRESPRFVWFDRAEVMALATGGAAAVAEHTEEHALEAAESTVPQIVNTEPKTSGKRRGRPRKHRLEVR